MNWHLITDVSMLELEENTPYLVCVEKWNGDDWVWHAVTAYWYLKDTEINLREMDGTPHTHAIKNTGFYIIHECGKDRYNTIYEIKFPQYYADIVYPESKPSDFLQIKGD